MSFSLSEISPQDQSWSDRKSYSSTVAKLYREGGYLKYADRIDLCSKHLEFTQSPLENEGELKLKLTRADFCRVRFCPVCQWRRSLKWCARFIEAFGKITKEFPEYRWIFLTVTVKNCTVDRLRSQLAEMQEAFGRLRKLSNFPGIGWIKSVEVTINSETGDAHPHFHSLLLVCPDYFSGRNYMTFLKWRSMWRDCLRIGYLPIINIKAVKQNDNALKVLAYLVKYSTKEGEVNTADELIEISRQLHQTRSIAVGGELKRFFAPVREEEDLIKISSMSDDKNKCTKEKLLFYWNGTEYFGDY